MLDAYRQNEWRGYMEEPDETQGPGWTRFYTSNPDFPISVAYPPGLSAWLDSNNPRWLKVELGEDLTIEREDLRLAALDGDGEAALILMRPALGASRLVTQLRRQHARQLYLGLDKGHSDHVYRVSPHGSLAGTDGSVDVFEVAEGGRADRATIGFVAGEGLWSLGPRLGHAIRPEMFAGIVASLRWRGPNEERRLRAQQAARALIHGAGENGMDVLRRRLARQVAALRDRPNENARILGIEVAFDPADLPDKPRHWLTSGHFRLVRDAPSEPLVYGSEELAASQLIDEAMRRHENGWTVDDALFECFGVSPAASESTSP